LGRCAARRPARGDVAVAPGLPVPLAPEARLDLLDARHELGVLAAERLDGVGELRHLRRALAALLDAPRGGAAAAPDAAVERLLGRAAQGAERALVAEDAEREDRRHLHAEVAVVDRRLEPLA